MLLVSFIAVCLSGQQQQTPTTMNTYNVTCTTENGTAIFAKSSTQPTPHEAARQVNALAQSKRMDHHFVVVELYGVEVARHIALSKGTIICK